MTHDTASIDPLDPPIQVAVIAPAQSRDDLEWVTRGVREQTYDHVTFQPVVRPDLGTSSARNHGASQVDADVYAFADADAQPAPHWVEELVAGFQDGMLAVGGPAYPAYDQGAQHGRVPDGWEWLIGAGPYHHEQRLVRNTYGCNFAVRADVFDALGGFHPGLGKGSRIPHGEETEFARRLHTAYNTRVQYRPDAWVAHHVTPDQLSRKALLARAYDQGVTKAVIGSDSEETTFITHALTSRSPWQYALLVAAGLGWLRGHLTTPPDTHPQPTRTPPTSQGMAEPRAVADGGGE